VYRRLLTVLIAIVAQATVLRAADQPKDPPITAEQRDHWAYRSLKRPPVPHVKNTNWPRNGIDRFVLQRMEQAGLQPAPQADRVTLIRRVTFDLTGLPPSPEDVDAFLQDRRPGAYERLVDRLLASPEFGEHQAQQWLDLARFAETDGFEHDKVRKNAWKYRDWVIDALNADLPYDQFVRLQLAADQLRPGDPSAARALGFLTAGPDMPDINLQSERRHSFLNGMAGTVGSVFLGLQFGCAQCHDHKYDAISQRDFYRLRAFFDAYFRFDRFKPIRMTGPSGTETVSHLMIRGDFRRKGPVLKPAFPRIVAAADSQPESTPRKSRRTILAEWLTRDDHPLTTRVIVNRLWQSHFGRGIVASPSDFGVMGDPPTHPQLLDWLAAELPRRDWSLKTLHRLMVTSATYRQASRLAASPAGRNRTAPSVGVNPTARGPRALTAAWNETLQKDPQNELWTRMPRRRLTGEAIRDAMLAASNSLSQRRGGPGVRPPLPRELVATLLKNQWPVSRNEQDHRRRSVYLFVRRNLNFPIFDVFDKPDTNASCARRNTSTTAPQALLLLNSAFSLEVAQRLAGDIRQRDGTTRDASVTQTYRRLLGRRPTRKEQRIALQFLDHNAAKLQSEHPSWERDAIEAAALTDFNLVLLNLNEFIYID